MEFVPTIHTLLHTLRYKKYRIYDAEDGFELNIVGVRTHGRLANQFDDYLTVFYRASGQWILNVFPATTDPGAYWLLNPSSRLGTAILKEGQYHRAYQLGKHQNRYRALVQRAEVTVLRDGNRDRTLDLDDAEEETGWFGINIHRASARNRSIDVDRWSAGCQVVADPRQFQLFLDLCDEGQRLWGNAFTYTLIHQRDFELAAQATSLEPRDSAELPQVQPTPTPRPLDAPAPIVA